MDELLCWAQANKVILKIVEDEKGLAVLSRLGNISAAYLIEDNFEAAVNNSLLSVKAGVDHHAERDITPGL